jgi:hypothetical protein
MAARIKPRTFWRKKGNPAEGGTVLAVAGSGRSICRDHLHPRAGRLAKHRAYSASARLGGWEKSPQEAVGLSAFQRRLLDL